jgi:phosphonate transport system substrate-binding protein
MHEMYRTLQFGLGQWIIAGTEGGQMTSEFSSAWASRRSLVVFILVFLLTASGCVSRSPDEGDNPGTLYISGIPDQNVSTVNRQHTLLAEYMSEQTGLQVEYVPMVDYAALVTAFERGDIHLAWFGALTGVQARALVEGSEAIAHRPIDAGFRSRFIVRADLPVDSLEDLVGLSFTFGSESSTSGHLMPRYNLQQAGIDPDEDFSSPPNYSGSHDRTIELVQSGAYDAGALNEAVWDQWLEEGRVDPDAVRFFYETPPYFNYNWTVRGGLDDEFGDGTVERILEALLEMDDDQEEILEMFHAERFVVTQNSNYDDIEEVARGLGLIR